MHRLKLFYPDPAFIGILKALCFMDERILQNSFTGLIKKILIKHNFPDQ